MISKEDQGDQHRSRGLYGAGMANRVLELVEERAEEIAATATSSEQLGRLDDRAVKALRECGVMDVLPKCYLDQKYGAMSVPMNS